MEILERISSNFVLLSAERSFFKSHEKIFHAIEAKEADEIKMLVKKDIMEVDRKFGAYLKDKT
jgi:DNA-binding GntR family transcriptional regulator